MNTEEKIKSKLLKRCLYKLDMMPTGEIQLIFWDRDFGDPIKQRFKTLDKAIAEIKLNFQLENNFYGKRV